MAGRVQSKDLYGRIVEAYREAPGNHSRAARVAGVDRRTSRDAWNKGWPRYPWAKPIKEALAEEHDSVLARAAAAERRAIEEARAEREAVSTASREAAVEEQRMVNVARKDVLAVLINAAELAPAMRMLAKLALEQIQKLAKVVSSDKQVDFRMLQGAMDLVDKHARLVSKAAHAADAIVKLSRLERGEPGMMVGIRPGPGSTIDDEAAVLSEADALAELETAASLVEDLRASGAFPELSSSHK